MEQGFLIQKVLRRFFSSKFLTLVFIFAPLVHADQVVPCASQVVCGEVGKVQISTSGTEKILEMSLDAVTHTIDIKGELKRTVEMGKKFWRSFKGLLCQGWLNH